MKLLEAAKVTAKINAIGFKFKVVATSVAMGIIKTTEALLDNIFVSNEVKI